MDDGSPGSGEARRSRTRLARLHRLAYLGLCLALLALSAGCGQSRDVVVTPETATVTRVGDGDTLDVRGGDRVRLVQIDAPELGEGECYAGKARRELERLAPDGARIVLEADPELDDVDRFGRLLRYVLAGQTNVNVELVRRGAAAPYFNGGDRGRYADALLDAVAEARDAGRGIWGACRVEWEPDRAVTTRPR